VINHPQPKGKEASMERNLYRKKVYGRNSLSKVKPPWNESVQWYVCF
jgi:hypothetical protein